MLLSIFLQFKANSSRPIPEMDEFSLTYSPNKQKIKFYADQVKESFLCEMGLYYVDVMYFFYLYCIEIMVNTIHIYTRLKYIYVNIHGGDEA